MIKIGKQENKHFIEDKAEMGLKHMKRCSTFLIIRKIEIKNNYIPFTPTRL